MLRRSFVGLAGLLAWPFRPRAADSQKPDINSPEEGQKTLVTIEVVPRATDNGPYTMLLVRLDRTLLRKVCAHGNVRECPDDSYLAAAIKLPAPCDPKSSGHHATVHDFLIQEINLESVRPHPDHDNWIDAATNPPLLYDVKLLGTDFRASQLVLCRTAGRSYFAGHLIRHRHYDSIGDYSIETQWYIAHDSFMRDPQPVAFWQPINAPIHDLCFPEYSRARVALHRDPEED